MEVDNHLVLNLIEVYRQIILCTLEDTVVNNFYQSFVRAVRRVRYFVWICKVHAQLDVFVIPLCDCPSEIETVLRIGLQQPGLSRLSIFIYFSILEISDILSVVDLLLDH